MNSNISIWLFRFLLYLFFDTIGYVLVNSELFSVQFTELLFILMFVTALFFESQVSKHRFFVLPPTILSLSIFLQVAISGLAYSAVGVGAWEYFDGDYSYILKAIWYSQIAVHVLWISFYLLPDFEVNFYKKVKIVGVSNMLIGLFILISLVVVFFGISTGNLGYVKDAEVNSYTTVISLGTLLGPLSIVFLTVYSYEDAQKRKVIYSLIIVYFIIGLFLGIKSTALSPIALFVISLYMTNRKIKKRFVLFFLLAIAISYVVIEPFRMYYSYVGKNYNTKSIGGYVGLYKDAIAFAGEVDGDNVESNFAFSFVERQSYVSSMCMAMQYADKNNFYIEDEWKNVALSPLYGVIPRFVWGSKPLANFGHFVSFTIYGSSEENSIGITAVGYSYLAARLLGVICFFIVLGLVQRLMFNIFYLNGSYIPFYIFFFILIALPGDAPWTYVSGSIQNLIIFLLILAFLVYTRIGKKVDLPLKK